MTFLRLKHWHKGNAHSQPYVFDADGHEREPYPEDDADRLSRTNRYPYDPECDFVFVGRISHTERKWEALCIKPTPLTPAQDGWRKMLQILYPYPAKRVDGKKPAADVADSNSVAGQPPPLRREEKCPSTVSQPTAR